MVAVHRFLLCPGTSRLPSFVVVSQGLRSLALGCTPWTPSSGRRPYLSDYLPQIALMTEGGVAVSEV